MKSLHKLGAALAVIGIFALAGCGGGGLFGSDSESAAPAPIKAGPAAPGTGVIQSIEPMAQDGRTIQKFTVRMDGSGKPQLITNATNAGFKTGDRVRIENGMMMRRN